MTFSPSLNKNGLPQTFFHGTDQHFETFDLTNDIGFHFGTKRAAMQRLKSLGKPEFEIIEQEPDCFDLDALEFSRSYEVSNNLIDRLSRARRQGFNIDRIAFHGSSRGGYVESSDIKFFDSSKIGDKWSADQVGFFFTTHKRFADDYALSDFDYREKGLGQGVVYLTYLKMNNPLIIDQNFLKKENMNPIGVTEDSISFWDNYQSLVLEWVDKGGHDGVIIQDSVHVDENGLPLETHVVFEPEQIRSIYAQFHQDMVNSPYLVEKDDPSFERVQLIDNAFKSIYPKLDNPNKKLKDALSKLSELELNQLISEYSRKENSPNYLSRLERARKGKLVELHLNGDKIGEFKSKRDAISYRASVRKGFLKEVQLDIQNALRLNDLGTWSPENIAREIGLSPSDCENLANCESDSSKYGYIKNILSSRGYDGIVYTNSVEDKGSDSFIVFNASQIKQLNKTLDKINDLCL